MKESAIEELSLIGSVDVSVKRDVEERKRTGVFYSPEDVISILTEWAIQDSNERILEPSFGGCGFLLSSRNRLVSLDNCHPEENLFGCDIDDAAFNILKGLFTEPDTERHFFKLDFLTVTADQFPLVDVVIGNPPYVSWHNMSSHQRHSASLLADSFGMPRNASLWMYFILKSLMFLKHHGRMAWILPGSFVFTDYSVRLRKILGGFFTRSIAVFLEERIFLDAGTEESTVVLLCEGFRDSSKEELQFLSVRNVGELGDAIANWSSGAKLGMALCQRPQSLMVPKKIYETFVSIGSSEVSRTFGELASIKIGLVTGANNFFILDDKTVRYHGIPEEFIDPIFAKFSQNRGISLTVADLMDSREAGQRCLFVNCRNALRLPEDLIAYLDTYPVEKRVSNYTFNKTRPVWYQIDDGVRPDGFLSAMQSSGPRFVLNFANSTCTNTMYQVTFIDGISVETKKMVAVSVQSTYGQFSAELEGRVRGGGALKLEPSEAKRLKLIIPTDLDGINAVFDEVDSYLREGKEDEAMDASDNFFVSKGLMTWNQVGELREGIRVFRSIRYGHR